MAEQQPKHPDVAYAEAREAFRAAFERAFVEAKERMTERGLERAIRDVPASSAARLPRTVTSLRRHARLGPTERPLTADAVRALTQFFDPELGQAVINARQELERAEAERSTPRDRSGRVVALANVQSAVHESLALGRRAHLRWAGVTQRVAFDCIVDACDATSRLRTDGIIQIELSMVSPSEQTRHLVSEPPADVQRDLVRQDERIRRAIEQQSLPARLVLRHYDFQPPMHGVLIDDHTLFLAGSMPTFRRERPLRYHLYRSGSQEFDDWRDYFVQWFECGRVVADTHPATAEAALDLFAPEGASLVDLHGDFALARAADEREVMLPVDTASSCGVQRLVSWDQVDDQVRIVVTPKISAGETPEELLVIAEFTQGARTVRGPDSAEDGRWLIPIPSGTQVSDIKFATRPRVIT